jgi:hypothetical protein
MKAAQSIKKAVSAYSEAARRRDKIRMANANNGNPSPAPGGNDCGCGPAPIAPRYSDSVCGLSSAPVIVNGARVVEDGSIELPKLKIPSPDQFFAASDRLGPNFSTKDNGELVVYSGNTDATTGLRQFDYEVDTEGLPGIYRITLTSPNAEQTKAARVPVDLLYKQFIGNLPSANVDAAGREGIVSFELETSANDSIVDIWAMPAVSLGSNRGQIIEPAMLGAIVIDGTVVSIAGSGDFLPASWGPFVTLGDVGEEGEDVTTSTQTYSSFTAGSRTPYTFSTYSGALPGYTVSVRAYGPVSSQYHSMARKLLAQVGG